MATTSLKSALDTANKLKSVVLQAKANTGASSSSKYTSSSNYYNSSSYDTSGGSVVDTGVNDVTDEVSVEVEKEKTAADILKDLMAKANEGQKNASALLEQMLASMSEGKYTPKTDEQIRQQAANEYQSYYDPLRLSAQQGYERNDLALQQQQEGLQDTYDKQREASAEQYRNAYSQSDRQMLSRGMQRSSYNAQTLANIAQKGAEAQQALWDQQGAAEQNIGMQRSQLAQQLSDTLAQYDASQAQSVLARIQALQDQEYERGVAAQQNAWTQQYQAAQLQSNLEQQAISNAQWQVQFDENVRQFNEQLAKTSGAVSSGGGGSYGGGSYSSYSKKSTTQKTTTDTTKTQQLPTTGGNLDWIGALNKEPANTNSTVNSLFSVGNSKTHLVNKDIVTTTTSRK